MSLPPFLHEAFSADDGHERWDAHQLAQEASHRLTTLRDRGFQPGDPIKAAVRPTLDFVAELCAWIAGGAEVLLLSPSMPQATIDELEARFDALSPCRPATLGTLSPCRPATFDPLSPCRPATFDPLSPCRPPQGDPKTGAGLDDRLYERFVAVLATSGTTGAPKLVPLRFAQFQMHAVAAARHLSLGQTDRWLACLPVHHVGGLSVIIRAMLLGNTVHVRESFDAREANRLLDSGAVSHASLVPTTFKRLLDERNDRPFSASVRMLLLGGAALPETLKTRARLIGAPVAATYGLTEACSQVTTLKPAEFLAGDDSSGGPLPGVEVTVRDASGRPVPDGADGEIWVTGPTVKDAYLGETPAASAHATGDWGALRGGRLFVLDRRTDLIVSGGENVYPAAVEETVRAFPGVHDCGVVGVPDEDWGARVVAIIEGIFDEAALREHCRERLPRHAVPKRFVAAADLPRTVSGKVRRSALRELVLATEGG